MKRNYWDFRKKYYVIFLELCTNGIDINENVKVIASLTPEQRKILKSTGNYFEILSNPKQFLKRSGYGKEDISRLTESYGRYLNTLEMEITEDTARKIGSATPFLGTISTYPANLIGGISSDLTAFGSTMASDFGFSHYNTIDVNHPGYQASVYVDALRGTVSDNLGEFGGTIYDRFNSSADNVVADMAAKYTKIPLLSYTGNLGTTVRDATIHGAAKDQAMNLGIGNVALNAIENLLFDGTTSSNNRMTTENIRKQLIEEIIKENMTDNLKNDIKYIINNNNEYAQTIQRLMKDGMSEDEAFETVIYQILLEIPN